MIYKATNLIKQEMEEKGLYCSINEDDDISDVVVGFGIENGPDVDVHFISSDNDNDVIVRVFGFINHVAGDKEDKILKVINECNDTYRYLKFVLSNGNNVDIAYDFSMKIDDASVGVEAFNIFAQCVTIVRECYPMFMKVMWE